MYLVSVFEKDNVIEASLGGRVTAEEIVVLAEEMTEILGDADRPFQLLLDYSRAKRMDTEAMQALNEMKDLAHELGISTITSVAADDHERAYHQTYRLQQVLEGTERYVLDQAAVQIASRTGHLAPVLLRLAA